MVAVLLCLCILVCCTVVMAFMLWRITTKSTVCFRCAIQAGGGEASRVVRRVVLMLELPI